MNSEEEKIQKVIRLKRYEAPPEGYFDDFLEEFQKRRDGEARSERASDGVILRSLAMLRNVGHGKMVLAGGLAYAALVMVVLSWPRGAESRPDNREPVIFEPGTDQVTPPRPKNPQDQPKKL